MIRKIFILSFSLIAAVLLLNASPTEAASSYKIDNYYSGDPSVETMPGDIYGIKFDVDDLDETHINIQFDSTSMPEWGDFYARCGARLEHESGERIWNSAWNSGFVTDETAGAGSDDGSFHILVPDTVGPTGDAFTYNGSLQLDGSLDGTGSWKDIGPTSISWIVSWDGVSDYVHYSYTFEVNQHDISHITIELGTTEITNVEINNTPVVPEPISTSLFLIGGSLLAGRRFFGRKK